MTWRTTHSLHCQERKGMKMLLLAAGLTGTMAFTPATL
jgi:hypothetical protein